MYNKDYYSNCCFRSMLHDSPKELPVFVWYSFVTPENSFHNTQNGSLTLANIKILN